MAPRSFAWVLRDRLAVCERPGGYGSSHRPVRRTEEIVWLKAQGFTVVVSTLAAPHNLRAYGEARLACRHVGLGGDDDASDVLAVLYPEVRTLLATGERVLLHHDEAGDVLEGIVAGYLVHAGLVGEPARAIAMAERLFHRPLGPVGRELVAAAVALPGAR